jgi:uncharacterized protein (DUF1501 family)
MLNRREFVMGLAAASTLGAIPKFAFGASGQGTRLLLVMLRGAMDGMDALRAYGDPNFLSLRSTLIDHGDIGHKLDANFALHPSLVYANSLFAKKELLPIVAVAPPYRLRSHFDAQDCLENGTEKPGGASNGWLDRCVRAMPGSEGLALAAVMPLIFRGGGKVSNWSPPLKQTADDGLLQRLQLLYANDSALSENFNKALLGEQAGMDKPDMMIGNARGGGQLVTMMTAAGGFMSKPDGPRVAFVEDTGWDSHRGQAVQLKRKLAELDAGLKAFNTAATSIWSQTIVVVVTEFGRTAALNGTGGTDHGTGGLMLMAGGAVQGGRVMGQWPGLGSRDLYEGRDLRTTTDMRSVFKALSAQHLGVAESAVESQLFPDSKNIRMMNSFLNT